MSSRAIFFPPNHPDRIAAEYRLGRPTCLDSQGVSANIRAEFLR
jgi:hypothetical protein